MSETVIIPSLRLGDRVRNCAGCKSWSQWLENTGDCMAYAYRRRELMASAENPADVPPQRSARCTSGGYVCDDFTPRAAPEPS